MVEDTDKDIEAVQDEKDKHEELKDENVAAGSQTLETILLESDQKGPGLKEDSLKDPDLKKDSTRDHDQLILLGWIFKYLSFLLFFLLRKHQTCQRKKIG